MVGKRLLASALAGTMAVSSIALVSADDTSAVKNEEQLQAYVESFEKFIDEDLEGNYGTVSTQIFENAYEYADSLIGDRSAEERDFTVAYYALQAAYNNLEVRTVEELKALAKSYKSVYDSENMFNNEGDEIYDNGDRDWPNRATWDMFVDAYEDALTFDVQDDPAEITDAYRQLEKAYNVMVGETNQVVTKSELKNLISRASRLDPEKYAYNQRMEGRITVGSTNYGVADAGAYWMDYTNSYPNSNYVEWGTMFDGTITNVDGGAVGGGATLEELIASAEETLENVFSFGVSRTTNDEVKQVYENLRVRVEMINAFEPDNTKSASVSSLTSLVKKSEDITDEAVVEAREAAQAILDADSNDSDERAEAYRTLQYAMIDAGAYASYNVRQLDRLIDSTEKYMDMEVYDNAFLDLYKGDQSSSSKTDIPYSGGYYIPYETEELVQGTANVVTVGASSIRDAASYANDVLKALGKDVSTSASTPEVVDAYIGLKKSISYMDNYLKDYNVSVGDVMDNIYKAYSTENMSDALLEAAENAAYYFAMIAAFDGGVDPYMVLAPDSWQPWNLDAFQDSKLTDANKALVTALESGSATVEGDLNADGVVDLRDLQLAVSAYQAGRISLIDLQKEVNIYMAAK
ncbi:MAG TPA: hypothetical protein H9671_04715 [Firmicutes bacterium]|nr:hypothetical protein [Bacillota bacterium]